MEPKDFLDNVEQALNSFYKDPSCTNLIKNEVNERDLAFKLAVFLVPLFKGKDIDVEYDRYGEGEKKLLEGIKGCDKRKKTDAIVPDILIHIQESRDKDNLAVFEIKSRRENDECDIGKLKLMTSKDGKFKYEFGVGLEFYTDRYVRRLFIAGEQQGDPETRVLA